MPKLRESFYPPISVYVFRVLKRIFHPWRNPKNLQKRERLGFDQISFRRKATFVMKIHLLDHLVPFFFRRKTFQVFQRLLFNWKKCITEKSLQIWLNKISFVLNFMSTNGKLLIHETGFIPLINQKLGVLLSVSYRFFSELSQG